MSYKPKQAGTTLGTFFIGLHEEVTLDATATNELQLLFNGGTTDGVLRLMGDTAQVLLGSTTATVTPPSIITTSPETTFEAARDNTATDGSTAQGGNFVLGTGVASDGNAVGGELRFYAGDALDGTATISAFGGQMFLNGPSAVGGYGQGGNVVLEAGLGNDQGGGILLTGGLNGTFTQPSVLALGGADTTPGGIALRVSDEAPGAAIALQRGSTDFLSFEPTGEWEVDGTPGEDGYLLTSKGAGAPPIWAAPPASLNVFAYRSDVSSTSPPPGDKKIRWNNSTQASATTLYVSCITDNSYNIHDLLAVLVPGDRLIFQKLNEPTVYQDWDITSVTDNTTYFTFGVTLTDSGGGNFPGNAQMGVGPVRSTGGGGSVTSVGMTVPSFLSVSGSPITTSGTLAVSYSGTALPVANGGTGSTSLTANNVLLGNGTSAVQVVAPGTTGNVLTSNGTTWTSAAPAASGSVYYKDPVRVATTANGTLASAFENGDTIDGVTLVTGNRILIKNQTTASENGIYTVNASGAPTRATDFDTSGEEVSNGCIIPVQFGTVNGGSTWQLVQNGGTIGNNFRFAPVNGVAAAGQAAWTTPVASSAGAIAIGNLAVASTNSGVIAIGLGTVASGSNAIAIGNFATATGGSSIAIGNNTGTGSGCVVIGNSIAGGSNNYLVIVGHGSTGSAVGATVIGQSSTASAVASSALGAGVFSRTNGFACFTGGGFSSINQAAAGIGKFFTTTTSATPVELGTTTTTSTAPTNYVNLVDDSSCIFDYDIVARNTATDTETAAWNLKFVIRRGAGAGTTTIVGTPNKTVLAQDTGTTTWDVSVTADTTNGRPNISVTGEASKTIRWVANARMTLVVG